MGTPDQFDRAKLYDEVALGRVSGMQMSTKNAFNEDVGTTLETVWQTSTPFDWTVYDTAPFQLQIQSTGAADSAGGTGIQEVFISGLDEDFNFKSEALELSGTTPVLTEGTYSRLNFMRATRCGSEGFAVGTVTAEPSGGGYAIRTIFPGFAKEYSAIFTTPADYDLLITQNTIAINPSQPGRTVDVVSFLKGIDSGVEVVEQLIGLSQESSPFERQFVPPWHIPTKHDFEIRAAASQNTTDIDVSYRGYSVKAL